MTGAQDSPAIEFKEVEYAEHPDRHGQKAGGRAR